jgi:Ca-activated chloride channel homolog
MRYGPEKRSRLMRERLVPAVIIICGLTLMAWAQEPANQQRPRRATDPGTKPNSGGDEVDEGDVLRVDTQLVSVSAMVVNEQGRPVSGLAADNFLLYENGQKQTIANFGTTQTPFEIALLLDTSGSTRADLGLIRIAANAFIDALRPGDRVAIVAFRDQGEGRATVAQVDVLAGLTGNHDVLHKAMENLGSSNGTPFYDALKLVAGQVFREPARDELRGRRAVVALTDGVDSSSDAGFREARERLLRAGLATYFIQVNTEDYVEDRLMRGCEDSGRLTLSARQLERYRAIFQPKSQAADFAEFCKLGEFEKMQISRDLYNLARGEMNDLAKVSGGRNFSAATLQEARAAFGRVAADIGTQYSLGYYPTNKARDGQYRTIRVEVQGLKETTQIHARQGYYAPK